MRDSRAGHIPQVTVESIPRFDRQFLESDNIISRIGGGAIGGKATGLVFAHQAITGLFPTGQFENFKIGIPRFVVVGADVYDAFVERNELRHLVEEDSTDERIAMTFQRAEFPAEFAGDIRALIGAVNSPLAVRSSSRLEDALYEPFAGVYGTKMIPNNQPDVDTRYRKLIEAIKFVYATSFFREARGYLRMIGRTRDEEKMAVIIQEVVGERHGDRFYPNFAGVGRSYNFYPVGKASPEEGVVDLALGLGKTIVDGGIAWSYSPAHPRVSPPFTIKDLLRHTQTEFWAVNMGRPPAYDPVRETEYLVKGNLADAEQDDVLGMIASTYDPANDRMVMGTGRSGQRVVDFAPVLKLGDVPFNGLVRQILDSCQERLDAAVEIEFAVCLNRDVKRFGFLQVRPMLVSNEEVEITEENLSGPDVLLASRNTLGNGTIDDLTDIIYVKPDSFDKAKTSLIAQEIEQLNRIAAENGWSYILIGFGRWGSSDPWLGIPVDWGNITGARVIVEATLPNMNVELSQGSHFFHNITSLQIPYFTVSFESNLKIAWACLKNYTVVSETEYVRYVRANRPLKVRLDGRSRRGLITK